MSQIYINTKQNEENRVIIVENNKLVSYEQEAAGSENKKGDIYKGIVTRLEKGLEVAFVDIGEEKNGFLPYKEIPANALGVSEDGISEGDSILVQIKKDHVGDKGAGLTSYITLAGCYLVLQPTRAGRVLLSKNCDRKTRAQMLEIVNSIQIPENMSAILRTAGMKCTAEQLEWDLNSYLLRLWQIIQTAAKQEQGPLLIYKENSLLLRVVRNHFRPDSDEVICDDPNNYQELRDFIALIFPGSEDKVRYHDSNDNILPDAIEEQIDHVLDREVHTRSGGRVVFDNTEAMVAVDVNSGRFISGQDIEGTALATNLEAAEIIASHLRLRNLAGLIVVDFIDMEKEANRKKLEEYFFTLLKQDRARVRCTHLSRFGLIEISRQRMSRSLVSSQAIECPHCHGAGQVWRTESFAIHMLRKIRAVAADSSMLLVQTPLAVGVFLLNEKRIEIRKIEDDCNCEIFIVPNENMQPPQYSIRPVKVGAKVNASHQLVEQKRQESLDKIRESIQKKMNTQSAPQQALIKNLVPNKTAPMTKKATTANGGGLLKRITASLTSAFKSDNAAGNGNVSSLKNGGGKGVRRGDEPRGSRRDTPATNAPRQRVARSQVRRPRQRTAENGRSGGEHKSDERAKAAWKPHSSSSERKAPVAPPSHSKATALPQQTPKPYVKAPPPPAQDKPAVTPAPTRAPTRATAASAPPQHAAKPSMKVETLSAQDIPAATPAPKPVPTVATATPPPLQQAAKPSMKVETPPAQDIPAATPAPKRTPTVAIATPQQAAKPSVKVETPPAQDMPAATPAPKRAPTVATAPPRQAAKPSVKVETPPAQDIPAATPAPKRTPAVATGDSTSATPPKKTMSEWTTFESKEGETAAKKPKPSNGKTAKTSAPPPPKQPESHYERVETEAETPPPKRGAQPEVVVLPPPASPATPPKNSA